MLKSSLSNSGQNFKGIVYSTGDILAASDWLELLKYTCNVTAEKND